VGLKVLPAIADNADDCCDKVHDVTLHLGPCAHLQTTRDEGGTRYRCAVYGDVRRPQLCEEYNCVGFAHASNTYNLNNTRIVAAQEALNELETTSMRECRT
jgi:hypothetical protein